jgi:hypothetical protein
MERQEELYKKPEISKASVSERRLFLCSAEELNAPALESESFEETQTALESVEALQDFRQKTNQLPFASFHETIEEITNLNKLPLSTEEKTARTKDLINVLEQRANRMSPRVADLYLGILAKLGGRPYKLQFDITRNKIEELEQKGDLDALFSGRTPWQIKLNRIETRLTDYLSGVRALDRREGKEMDDDLRKWREEELKKAPSHPPQRRNESKPGVDPMERLKEGERAPAMWEIEPGFSGTKYFKEQSFSRWDANRNAWVENEYRYSDIVSLPLLAKEDRRRGLVNITMTARVLAGGWVSCPVPYTHGLHKIEAVGKRYKVQQDQNGDLVIFIEGSGEAEVRVMLAAKESKRLASAKPEGPAIPEIPSEFSEETNKKLAELRGKNIGNIVKARLLASYIVSRIKYLAPKSREEADKHNTFYNGHPKGFAGAVDEIREGDCDVVNTYFAALCSKLNIPVRHAVGHSVKGKDQRGNSSINSGTGHGWSEVWDETRNEWVLIDATPAGDPNLEDEKEKGGTPPSYFTAGDEVEQEAVRPSDEKLEELRKKLAEHKEKLSYTREERQLAEAAGIELKEARQVVKEIKEAESARLSDGELVVDVMARLFDVIAESRKRELPAYSGPVRRREGGENISDIIRHYIGVRAGESDPMSRERLTAEIKEEKLLNGMDVYVIGDKSGSMQDIVDGERLWELQRRFEYLLFSSFYRFNRDLEKAHLSKDKNLDVRTMAISFRGDTPEEIDLDKALSPRFTAEDKVKMWRSLSEAGGGNGDVAAIQYIYQKIKEEKEEMARQGIKDNRLRIVVAYSDGGYVGAEAQMRGWAEEMSKLNVVVVGIGLTESAATVPIVMHNPPKSFGEIVSNLEELTAATAKHIVLQAIKLFPEKARKNAEQLIEETLHKFGAIK